MSDENKKTSEPGGDKPARFSIHTIFYHNTFLFLFSLVAALVLWFFITASSTETPRLVSDVPITVKLSASAEADGLKVFNMSSTAADLEISGSTILTNKLSVNDFLATVTLSPVSTKLTGNTLQKMTVPVKVNKTNVLADYEIQSVTPEEIIVEYDRYKETTFIIENQLKYTADSAFFAGTPILSEDEITVSGPESSLSKISRVGVEYTFGETLKADQTVSCPVVLYDQNNQKISDTASLYLTLSNESVDVTIPVSARKAVNIVPVVVNRPKNFADSRITVEPAQIEITGSQEALSTVNEISLATPIDFSELDVTTPNEFEVEIPMPNGVKPINTAAGGVATAKVTVNLNGYQQVKVTTKNIVIAKGNDAKNVELNSDSLEITLIGSEAQVSKLTGTSISCQIDPTNFADKNGSVEVPVTVSVTGSGFDSCWSVGKYTAYITVSDKTELAAAPSGSAAAVGATPQQ